jgi:hypothetical protein
MKALVTAPIRRFCALQPFTRSDGQVSGMFEPMRPCAGPYNDRFVNGQVAGVIRVSVPFRLWPPRALVHLTRRLDGVFKASLDRDQSIAASARKERCGLLGH